MLATDDAPATTSSATSEQIDDLDTALVTMMDRTISRYQRAIRLAIEQSEGQGRLTMPQLRCLQAISADGTALTTQLARRMNVAVPTMTSMIDGLTDRGLVGRHPDPADRRQVRIVMTEEGYVVLHRYQEIVHTRLRGLVAHLSAAQQRRLLSAMHDIATMLDADDRATSEKPKGNG